MKTKKILTCLLAATVILALFHLGYSRTYRHQMTGVYWGAFDPPTAAHAAIIKASLQDIPLKKLIIVVNNHFYKNYTNSLETRLELMSQLIRSIGHPHIELTWQDNSHKVDFTSLSTKTSAPLCAIAGYDSYKKWVTYSNSDERRRYDAIAVVPRGDEEPILCDQKAFLLPIKSKYRHVSSTKVRAAPQVSSKPPDLIPIE